MTFARHLADSHLLRKAFIALLLIATGMNVNAGPFGIGGNTRSWKEEVLLHDGQVMVAERIYYLSGFPSIGSRDQSALDETVTFRLVGTKKKITWKSDFRDTVPEQNNLNLLLLDVVEGMPYIATYPAGCIAYNKWQRPNPPYVLFKYENGEWKRISLAEFPSELNSPNVIVGGPKPSLLKTNYTVDQVKEENHDIRERHYKIILREPLSNERIEQMCEERVLYKGSWILPNDPVARRIIDMKKR